MKKGLAKRSREHPVISHTGCSLQPRSRASQPTHSTLVNRSASSPLHKADNVTFAECIGRESTVCHFPSLAAQTRFAITTWVCN